MLGLMKMLARAGIIGLLLLTPTLLRTPRTWASIRAESTGADTTVWVDVPFAQLDQRFQQEVGGKALLITKINEPGYYWSTEYIDSGFDWYLYFNLNSLKMDHTFTFNLCGQSIRFQVFTKK